MTVTTEPPRDREVTAGRGRRPRPAGVSRWRALLEARWQERLQEVTELSVAFHEAGAQPSSARSPKSVQQLMRRAVRARRSLADTDDALSKLSGGRFGRCEECSAVIAPATLLRVPETRYCAGCA